MNRKTISLQGNNEGMSRKLFAGVFFINILKERIHAAERVEIQKHSPSGYKLLYLVYLFKSRLKRDLLRL